jgi:cobalt-zinc-cadmium efflux system membrane fusion protein
VSGAGLRAWIAAAPLVVSALGCSDAKQAAPTPAAREAAPTAAAAHEEKPPTTVEHSDVKLCEHRVPADQCTKCNPDLVAVYRELGDWCGTHGVPESHCYECNPGLTFGAKRAASGEPWCNEHGVPEAECTKCKPQLIAKFIAANDFCREHGLPESVCPSCHPEKVKATGHEPPTFPAPGTKVKLASAQTEGEAGIQWIRAEQRSFAQTLEVVGQLDFNQNRLARLSARGEGLVIEVKVDIGDEVKAGQPLVVLASAAIGENQSMVVAAKARLDAARSTVGRETSLQQSGITSKRSVEQAQSEAAAAQAEYDAARAALRAAGAGELSSGGRYVLTAPFAGTVVTREAVAGRSVSMDTTLIEIADLSTMWAMLDVPEESAASIRIGQRVTVRIDGLGSEAREAVIARVAAAVDPHTRTVEARVDLPNPDRSLRSGLFLRGAIETSTEHQAMLVPTDAVQRAEGKPLVFVRTAPGQYDPVAVELGARAGKEVEILKGLTPGAEIVTAGAFMLKTEILKDSIGAGCTDD